MDKDGFDDKEVKELKDSFKKDDIITFDKHPQEYIVISEYPNLVLKPRTPINKGI